MRRSAGSSSELPTSSTEYRAGKSKKTFFHSAAMSPSGRRVALLLVGMILFSLCLLLGRRGPSSLFRLLKGCENQSSVLTVPIFDGFAQKAASQRPESYASLSKLVMVAGHAIYTGRSWTPSALHEESNWVLEPFQRGQVSTFLAHIERGVALASNDSSALLVFSGGQTRLGAGPRSEASTYWLVADALGWFGRSSVRERAVTEEYARDSLENLLFAMCRFRQIAGRYPESVDVVSFGFKEARFVEVHRRALRFPRGSFRFIGVDPPGMAAKLRSGELKNSMGPFASDPHGCSIDVLRRKKIERNPYLRYFPYPQGCPELQGLFNHCGRTVYKGTLPWDSHESEEKAEPQD